MNPKDFSQYKPFDIVWKQAKQDNDMDVFELLIELSEFTAANEVINRIRNM